MDLLDLWRPNDRLSWRKLGVLITQLPPESATATRLRVMAEEDPEEFEDLVSEEPDPENEQWSRVEHILASIRDEIHALRWQYSSAHSGKQRLKWKPEPLPRPGVKPAKRKVRLNEQQTGLLAAHLARTQPEPDE